MEKHDISIDGVIYKLSHDEYTGDWCVHSDEDNQVQQEWILTKEGAINYIVNSAGLRKNDNYRRAPDRC